MKFSMSNIAWPPDKRLKAYSTLAENGFSGLEIAPSLFFFGAYEPFEPNVNEQSRATQEIANFGLTLCSMQSVLYNVQGAALFEDDDALRRLEAGIKGAIRLAGRLEIPNLVFGSPKQRIIPKGMSLEKASDRAASLFFRIGDTAKLEGTQVAMEANPTVYGTNFLTTGKQALTFARRVGHPAVRFILDVGAMHINEEFEQIPKLIEEAADLLSHVHFSEPQLMPAPADATAAAKVLSSLDKVQYDRAVSIEMKAVLDAPIEALSVSCRKLNEARKISDRQGNLL